MYANHHINNFTDIVIFDIYIHDYVDLNGYLNSCNLCPSNLLNKISIFSFYHTIMPYKIWVKYEDGHPIKVAINEGDVDDLKKAIRKELPDLDVNQINLRM